MQSSGVVTPDMQEVGSKNIHSVGYDPLATALFVRFRKKGGPGSLYRYSGVPENEHTDLMAINDRNMAAGESGRVPESMTKHFNARIKSRPMDFPFEKLEDAPPAVAA